MTETQKKVLDDAFKVFRGKYTKIKQKEAAGGYADYRAVQRAIDRAHKDYQKIVRRICH